MVSVVKFLEEMNQNNCPPNVFTYNALISGFCRVERWEEAKWSLSRMKEGGLPPNKDIYTSLISCCCKLSLYSEAASHMNSMVECGYIPHLESYRFLRNFEKAKSVFRESLERGYNFDEIAWKILLEGVLGEGHANAFSEMFSIMQEKNCCISSQNTCYVDHESSM